VEDQRGESLRIHKNKGSQEPRCKLFSALVEDPDFFLVGSCLMIVSIITPVVVA
jgi:hypothetical protein